MLPLAFLKVGPSNDEVMGRIVLELRPDVVPQTVKNFIALCTGSVDGMTYKGTTFNRIIPDFMIQGGKIQGPHESSFGGRFKDESFELKHDRPGVLSMANRGPDTNGTSFFITTVPTPWLDNKHVVLGSVIEGMKVVSEIEAVGSNSGIPNKEIFILDCGILE